jgi:hypothetical protein
MAMGRLPSRRHEGVSRASVAREASEPRARIGLVGTDLPTKGDNPAHVSLRAGRSPIQARRRYCHHFLGSSLDPPSRITYEIEPMGATCKLTMTHDGFETETATYRRVAGGWSFILSGLKTLLETGEPLQVGEPEVEPATA